MTKLAILIALSFLLAGCAAHPGDIAPQAPMSSARIQSLSCEGLAEALEKAESDLEAASERQMKRHLWRRISKGSREAVARHKGEVQLIVWEIDARCR